MVNRISTLLVTALLLAGCNADNTSPALTTEERLAQSIQRDMRRQGVPQMDVSGLSVASLKAISHILNDDSSQGQKGGRIAAVIRRG